VSGVRVPPLGKKLTGLCKVEQRGRWPATLRLRVGLPSIAGHRGVLARQKVAIDLIRGQPVRAIARRTAAVVRAHPCKTCPIIPSVVAWRPAAQRAAKYLIYLDSIWDFASADKTTHQRAGGLGEMHEQPRSLDPGLPPLSRWPRVGFEVCYACFWKKLVPVHIRDSSIRPYLQCHLPDDGIDALPRPGVSSR
jgi:hypothetical protein